MKRTYIRIYKGEICKYLPSQYYLFTILGTVVDLEPLHNHVHATSTNINSTGLNSNQDQIENAVIKQELMASKEEIADLKAKIYVSDKEKTGKITLLYILTKNLYMIFTSYFSNSKELLNPLNNH